MVFVGGVVQLVIVGDALEELKKLASESVDCCVTSPPYWGLRDYGDENQLGLEKTPEAYVAKMVAVFFEVRRVLKKEGTCWLNLGDSYSSTAKGSGGGGRSSGLNCKRTINGDFHPDNHSVRHFLSRKVQTGLKPKDLVGIPWRVAFALQTDGWYLRQDIIWAKPNPMPESVTDRCTKAHEYVFLLTKSGRYYFDGDAIKESSKDPTDNRAAREKGYGNSYISRLNPKTAKCYSLALANKRSVWTVTTKRYKEAHFAVFPEKLIEPMIQAGCPKGGTVLDPFLGSGTTAVVAKKLGRKCIGIELNPSYVELANKRLAGITEPMF